MKKSLAVIACLFLLAACADDAPPPMVKLESDASPPIKLDVLTVVVLNRSNPLPGDTPYNSNNFQPTIGNAVQKWATEKLVAVGSTGQAFVIINDSSLKAQSIPHPDSMFTREQTSKYAGHVSVDLNVKGREGYGQVSAEASQFETLPETPTTAERQNAYTKLLNRLMHDFGNNMRTGIRDHLNNFVVTAPVLPE